MDSVDGLITIPDPVGDRYASFELLSWWDRETVRRARVLVIGAGALGNEVLKNLALMGVGSILVVDFDRVETGNLGRSVLFREKDSGDRKADVACRAVKDLNPDVCVQASHADVNHGLGLGVFRRMDAIIGCLDNREARLSINRACWLLRKPWIDGGIEALLGYTRVFWPGRGACYECTLTNRDYQLINIRRSCGLLARENILRGKVPTTPTAAAIVGGMQTQEALKLIHGMEVQSGKSFNVSGLTNDNYSTKLPEKADCLSHESFDEIIEIPDATAGETTLREFLSHAERTVGAEVELHLGHDLVTELRCGACGQSEKLLVPAFRVTESFARCASCGTVRAASMAGAVGRGLAGAAELKLAELGVPPLGIITVYHDGRLVGLELTGDATMFFTFQ